MKSLNKTVVIVVVVVVVLVAIFSFKTYVLGAGSTEGAKAAIDQKRTEADTTKTVQSTHEMPASEGLHMPGNKNH
jgi:hypothetical protein